MPPTIDLTKYQKHIDALTNAHGMVMVLTDAKFLANEYALYTNEEFDALPLSVPRRTELVPVREARDMYKLTTQVIAQKTEEARLEDSIVHNRRIVASLRQVQEASSSASRLIRPIRT